MKQYFEVVGIIAHIALVVVVVGLGINGYLESEANDHEYAMVSIYTDQVGFRKGLEPTIVGALSDGKLSHADYYHIERRVKELDNIERREKLDKFMSK